MTVLPDGRGHVGCEDGSIRLYAGTFPSEPKDIGRLHTDWVWSLSPTRDGLMASGGGDNCVNVIDLHTMTIVKKLTIESSKTTEKEWVVSVAFSHSGKFLLAATTSGRLFIWDCIAQWSQIADQQLDLAAGEGQRKKELLSAVMFTPDDRYVIVSSTDRVVLLSGSILSERTPAMPLFSFAEEIGKGKSICVACSPDGKWLATGGSDNFLRVWKLDSNTPVVHEERSTACPGHDNKSGITAVAYSPDGKHIVTAFLDATLIVWDASNGQLLWRFTEAKKKKPMLAVEFINGETMACAGLEGAVYYFSVINT